MKRWKVTGRVEGMPVTEYDLRYARRNPWERVEFVDTDDRDEALHVARERMAQHNEAYKGAAFEVEPVADGERGWT